MAIVQAPPTTLADASAGRYRCDQVFAEGENAVRLKRIGLCEGRIVELVGQGDPMVLRIGTSRVGLSRQLAKLVKVTPVGGESSYGSPSTSAAY
ncbi:MAG: ferrous iron transport protein A [Planctomycetales bacterium]|nr:ferrous iron transport protein A [Planctomycetales bacterium]